MNTFTHNELILMQFLINQFDEAALAKIKHRVTLNNEEDHEVVAESAYTKIWQLLIAEEQK